MLHRISLLHIFQKSVADFVKFEEFTSFSILNLFNPQEQHLNFICLSVLLIECLQSIQLAGQAVTFQTVSDIFKNALL